MITYSIKGWSIIRESRSSHLLRSFSQPNRVISNSSSVITENSSSPHPRISATAKITHKARGAQDLFNRVLQRSISQPASFKPQQQQQHQPNQTTANISSHRETTAIERSNCSISNSICNDSNAAFNNNSSRGEWSSSSARKECHVEWTHAKSTKGPKQLLRR